MIIIETFKNKSYKTKTKLKGNNKMSKISTQAIINFPKVEEVTNQYGKSYNKFSCMLILQKNDATRINDFLQNLKKSQPKGQIGLKEVDREKIPNLDNKFTHYINVSSNIDFMTVTDIRKNIIDISEIKSGDLIFCLLHEKISQFNKKWFLGFFINQIALIEKKYAEVYSKTEEEIDFLDQLDSLANNQITELESDIEL